MPRDYELIDFGDGRKLESLAGYLIDRPSPAAIGIVPATPREWQRADAVFDEVTKRWQLNRPWPASLSIAGLGFQLAFRPTPFGHIGAFPEQRENWYWLSTTVRSLKELQNVAPPHTLNLFAHTGGSTFAMAAAGAAVVHLDAAKPNVVTAKEAALASGLGEASIRYIVDDAAKFMAREVRRQRQYDVIVMDPPAYGHAPDGKAWRIERDLWPLIDDALQLINPLRGALLFTGHSEAVDHNALIDYLRQHPRMRISREHRRIEAGRSQLLDRAKRPLDTGFYVRVQWAQPVH